MKYKVLIVDDERELADSTAEYFNMLDLKTCCAYTASETLEFFKENETELILLDINLEDLSGFELCKTLRERTDVPILFISARSSDDDMVIALNIGGDDYITKPYSLSVLDAKVRAVLQRYERSSGSTGDVLALSLGSQALTSILLQWSSGSCHILWRTGIRLLISRIFSIKYGTTAL